MSKKITNPAVSRLVEQFQGASVEGAAKASGPFLELVRLMPDFVGRELSKDDMIREAENLVGPSTTTQEVAIDLVRRDFLPG